MQVHVDQRQPHHVGRDVVAREALRQPAALVGRERALAVGVGVGALDVLVGGDQEAGGAAGGIENGFVQLRVHDLHDEVDDVARRAELPGVALGAHDGQQVLEGVAQALGMVVFELVDDLQELAQRLGVAVRQIGVVEDAAKERRDARVLRNPVEGFGVEAEGLESAQAGAQQLRPGESLEVVHKEAAPAAEFLAPRLDVPHELVDQRDGDLLDLRLGVGDLAHEDVAGGIDTAAGFDV